MTTPFTVSCFTIGCKLNQMETGAAADAFVKAGFTLLKGGESEEGAEKAAVFVINTCAVTSKAQQKARRLIRKIARENPGALVIATGCYAELARADLARLGSSLVVLPGAKKSLLLEFPAFLRDSSGGNPEKFGALAGEFFLREGPGDFVFFDESGAFHSRPFLKIQDGCDEACTYCSIRLARGKSRCAAPGLIAGRLSALEERGYAEAALTGVNIGAYSCGGLDLPGLLGFLLEETRRISLRISSTHIEGVNDDFIRAVSRQRIRPHFHLSIQSGSGKILRRMGRRYGPEDIYRAVERLRAAKGDPFLGCDIIAGFPGESEEDFRETLCLCREAGFAGIHAFPFSPRPGTAAWGYKPPVKPEIAADRVAALRSLAASQRQAYIERCLGKTLAAVVEQNPQPGVLPYTGVTENYLKVHFSPDFALPPPGCEVSCILRPGRMDGEAFPAKEKSAIPLFIAKKDALEKVLRGGRGKMHGSARVPDRTPR
jgi:threonylcarbamoyladenosine tRNA methylthiotransferase MtaB